MAIRARATTSCRNRCCDRPTDPRLAPGPRRGTGAGGGTIAAVTQPPVPGSLSAPRRGTGLGGGTSTTRPLRARAPWHHRPTRSRPGEHSDPRIAARTQTGQTPRPQRTRGGARDPRGRRRSVRRPHPPRPPAVGCRGPAARHPDTLRRGPRHLEQRRRALGRALGNRVGGRHGGLGNDRRSRQRHRQRPGPPDVRRLLDHLDHVEPARRQPHRDRRRALRVGPRPRPGQESGHRSGQRPAPPGRIGQRAPTRRARTLGGGRHPGRPRLGAGAHVVVARRGHIGAR